MRSFSNWFMAAVVAILISALLFVPSFFSPIAARADPETSCQLTWSVVQTPNVSAANYSLNGVHALATNDVWAVGDSQGKTFTEHWDGNVWQVVDSPNVSAGSGHLYDVDGSKANDVWAVGFTGVDSTTVNALLLHWDGSAWHIVPALPIPGNAHALSAVHALASNDVWAVGWYQENYMYKNLALHWDGTTWTRVAAGDTESKLRDVSAVSSNDVWAVGDGVFHWDGTTWSKVGNLAGNAIVALGPNDVWVTGFWHWDGAHWTSYSPENVGTADFNFTAIDALAPDNLYAVGFSSFRFDASTLSQHWNGTQWRSMLTPNGSNRISVLNAISMLSANEGWAVGTSSSLGSVFSGLLLHATEPCVEPPPPPETPTPAPTLPPTPTPRPPRPPKLLAPPDGATVKKLKQQLDWNDIGRAQGYEVEIYNRSGADELSVSQSQWKSDALERGATYKWRIRSCLYENFQYRCGEWSAPWQFTIRDNR